jgi:hypothetical protein
VHFVVYVHFIVIFDKKNEFNVHRQV